MLSAPSRPVSSIPPWLLYVICVVIWGSSWYGIRQQLGVVSPQVSLSYRFLLAAVILLAFCAVTRRSLRFPLRAHIFMALQGLFLFCGNYILFYYAGMHVVSGLLAVCFSTMSVMVGRLGRGSSSHIWDFMANAWLRSCMMLAPSP